MSKTFKTITTTGRTLKVSGVKGKSVYLEISSESESRRNINLGASDAPALALTVLEAVGADSDLTWSGAKDYGNADHLGWIAGHLDAYIKSQERITAEAEERAELEAEALDYWKAFNNATDLVSFDDIQWSDLLPDSQAKWLAVARRAREMNRA